MRIESYTDSNSLQRLTIQANLNGQRIRLGKREGTVEIFDKPSKNFEPRTAAQKSALEKTIGEEQDALGDELGRLFLAESRAGGGPKALTPEDFGGKFTLQPGATPSPRSQDPQTTRANAIVAQFGEILPKLHDIAVNHHDNLQAGTLFRLIKLTQDTTCKPEIKASGITSVLGTELPTLRRYAAKSGPEAFRLVDTISDIVGKQRDSRRQESHTTEAPLFLKSLKGGNAPLTSLQPGARGIRAKELRGTSSAALGAQGAAALTHPGDPFAVKRFAYSTLPVIREALREQGKEKLAEKLSLAVGKFLDPEQKSSDFTFRQAELVKVGAEVSKALGKHPLAEASREVFSQIASGSISPLENLLAAKPGDIAVVIDKIGEPELAQAYRDVEKSVSSQSDIKLTDLHLANAELQVLNAVLLERIGKEAPASGTETNQVSKDELRLFVSYYNLVAEPVTLSRAESIALRGRLERHDTAPATASHAAVESPAPRASGSVVATHVEGARAEISGEPSLQQTLFRTAASLFNEFAELDPGIDPGFAPESPASTSSPEESISGFEASSVIEDPVATAPEEERLAQHGDEGFDFREGVGAIPSFTDPIAAEEQTEALELERSIRQQESIAAREQASSDAVANALAENEPEEDPSTNKTTTPVAAQTASDDEDSEPVAKTAVARSTDAPIPERETFDFEITARSILQLRAKAGSASREASELLEGINSSLENSRARVDLPDAHREELDNIRQLSRHASQLEEYLSVPSAGNAQQRRAIARHILSPGQGIAAALGAEGESSDPAAFIAFLRAEIPRYRDLLATANSVERRSAPGSAWHAETLGRADHFANRIDELERTLRAAEEAWPDHDIPDAAATLSDQINHAAEVTEQLSGIDPKTDKIPGNWKEITAEQLDELQNILQQELINRSSGTLAETTVTNNQLRRIIGQIVSLKYLESLDDLEAFTEFWAVRKGSYLPVPEPDEAAAAELYPLIESRIEDVRNQLAGIGPATSSPTSEAEEFQARPNEEVFESIGTAGTSLTDPIKDLSVSITRDFLGERLEVLTAASAYVRPLGVALHDAYKA